MVIAYSQSPPPSHSLGRVAPQVMAMIESNQELIRAAAKWHTSSRLLVATCGAAQLHHCLSTRQRWVVLSEWFISYVFYGVFSSISAWVILEGGWQNHQNSTDCSASTQAVYIDNDGAKRYTDAGFLFLASLNDLSVANWAKVSSAYWLKMLFCCLCNVSITWWLHIMLKGSRLWPYVTSKCSDSFVCDGFWKNTSEPHHRPDKQNIRALEIFHHRNS